MRSITAALLAGADPERVDLGLTQLEVDVLWRALEAQRADNQALVDGLQFVVVAPRATPGFKALPTW